MPVYLEPNVELTGLISNVTEVVNFLVGKFTSILALFTSEPLLMLLLGIMVMGAIIGLSMRVLHRR